MNTGYLEGRFERALNHGGMVCQREKVWYVFRKRDRRSRPIGVMHNAIVDRLIEDGALISMDASSHCLVWNCIDEQPDIQFVGPLQAHKIMKRGKSVRRSSLLVQVLNGCGTAAETRRYAQAARRFCLDSERAVTPQSVTMSWEAGPVSGRGRSASSHGPGELSIMAVKRLRALKDAVGGPAFAILELALIAEVSRTRLARRLGISPKRALKMVADSIDRLAWAYDTVLPADD